jgi:hypothetical protein
VSSARHDEVLVAIELEAVRLCCSWDLPGAAQSMLDRQRHCSQAAALFAANNNHVTHPGSLLSYRAARVAFWCGVAIAGTLLLHIVMIVIVRVAGWRPPAWLEFPRAELAVLLLLLQPIAQCTGRESPHQAPLQYSCRSARGLAGLWPPVACFELQNAELAACCCSRVGMVSN